MGNKNDALYNQALTILKRLHTKYPNFTLGRHLSVAFSDYGDLESVSPKEFVFGLEKYEAELEIESPIAGEDELNKIISDGMNLDHILDEDEEEDF
jgi:hypothetical protein